jgi:uncharacterized repeat protein (TIGR03803 family)
MGLAVGVVIASALVPWTGAAAFKFRVIHSFCGNQNCSFDISSDLSMDALGNLYGTTTQGGTHERGTAFKLSKRLDGPGWAYSLLYSFCRRVACTDGAYPSGYLVVDTSGNLYGVAPSVGFGHGIAFRLAANPGHPKWRLEVLHTFCSRAQCIDGDRPLAGLTYAGATSGAPYDGVSPLYGVTYLGGTQDDGVVFELSPSGGASRWSERVLYDFCSVKASTCLDGMLPGPDDRLVMDPAGNLYGMTENGGSGGGSAGGGTIFELQPNGAGWSETVLYNFCSVRDCRDGAWPYGGLLMDSAGTIYGATTWGGGHEGAGVVFKLVPNGSQSQYTVLYTFCRDGGDCGDGRGPWGGLVMDGNGNLFGTTAAGGGFDWDLNGSGGGTLFKISGSSLQKIHSFCSQGRTACLDGEYPHGTLLRGSDGTLFGTGELGGQYQGGVVFELKP